MAHILRGVGNAVPSLARNVSNIFARLFDSRGVDVYVEIELNSQAKRDISAHTEMQMVVGIARVSRTTDPDLPNAAADTAANGGTVEADIAADPALGAGARHRRSGDGGTVGAVAVLDVGAAFSSRANCGRSASTNIDGLGPA